MHAAEVGHKKKIPLVLHIFGAVHNISFPFVHWSKDRDSKAGPTGEISVICIEGHPVKKGKTFKLEKLDPKVV